jgi:hypothetical protein
MIVSYRSRFLVALKVCVAEKKHIDRARTAISRLFSLEA